MAIFGRNTARQRLRRAAQESLKIPAFRSPVDCTPWVTGGLWPAELSTVTAETAPLVKYLKADLQRIVNSANEELKNIRCAGLIDSTRQAEEARVINDARAFAAELFFVGFENEEHVCDFAGNRLNRFKRIIPAALQGSSP